MSDFAYPLHEECGVFGIYDRAGTEDVAAAAYSALYALQHRGQESCGIAVNDDGVIQGHRDLGLVNEVFDPRRAGQSFHPHGPHGNGSCPLCHGRQPGAGQRPAHDRPAWPGHHGPLPQRQPDQCPGAAPSAGERGCHLPRLLRYRGHLLPHHPQPPADGQH